MGSLADIGACGLAYKGQTFIFPQSKQQNKESI